MNHCAPSSSARNRRSSDLLIRNLARFGIEYKGVADVASAFPVDFNEKWINHLSKENGVL